MDRKDLFSLIKNGLDPQVSAEFSANDANSAAVNAICEQFGISMDSNIREIRAYAPAAFALIEEAVDEMLPARLTNVLGAFAEVKQFARDAEVIFKIGKVGKARARLSITKGARGGIYRAARLDAVDFQVSTDVYTVGIYVTLEDIILGTYTLAELYTNILEGFEEIVYKETVEALQGTSAALGTANNRFTVSGSLTLASALDSSIQIVKNYGTPLIIGFYSQLAKIYNIAGAVSTYTPNINQKDLDEIREVGHISKYKGVTMVEIPNYLKDNNNNVWLLNDDYVFVIPSDAKPVKVALKGELTLIENKQPTGSEKWEAHKLMGVGVAMNYNYCVIDCE